MKFKTNIFTSLVFVVMIVFSSTACTQEKVKEAQKAEGNNKHVALASQIAPFPVSVAYIEAVSAPTKGKAVDFNWTLNGKPVSFKEFTKDKVVFLNFWGTWCPPCRREIPDLVSIANDLKDKDFVMIGIPQERNIEGAKDAVSSYAETQKIPYINLIDTKYDLAKAYGGINAVPTTIIIDKKGNIAETITGMRGKTEFMESIKRVLK